MRKGGWFDGVYKAKGEYLVKHIAITSHAPPELVLLDQINDLPSEWTEVVLQPKLVVRASAP